jgi:hypothetical protein
MMVLTALLTAVLDLAVPRVDELVQALADGGERRRWMLARIFWGGASGGHASRLGIEVELSWMDGC